MMMSSVRLVAILAKAAPMITATARSSTFPLAMKARNSASIGRFLLLERLNQIAELAFVFRAVGILVFERAVEARDDPVRVVDCLGLRLAPAPVQGNDRRPHRRSLGRT